MHDPRLSPKPRQQIIKRISLHQTQYDFHRSTSLYRGFVGGRGSGKSWIGAYDLLRRAKPGRLYLVGAPTYETLGTSTLRSFLNVGRELQVIDPKLFRRGAPPSCKLPNGAEILFRSADNPERFRGPNISGCWLDEGSLMEREAYDIVIACLREAGEMGWLSLTFTPKGQSHWTYELFGKQPPQPNTELFHSCTSDNPFLPSGFEAALRAQYGEGSLFEKQELGGSFVSPEGVEWPEEYFGRHIWFDRWPEDIICRVLYLDPSKGRADQHGDYSAYIMLGVDRNLHLWVDADLDKTRPVEAMYGTTGRSMAEDGVRLFVQFKPQAFCVETNGFQEWVPQALYRFAAEKGIVLPLWGMNNTENKQTRIRSLGTYFAQRRFHVRDTPGGRLLVSQLQEFPVAVHDDGPDALKGAETMANRLMNGASGDGPAPFLLAA